MKHLLAATCGVLLAAATAHAHTTATGLATLRVEGATVRYQLALVSAEFPEDVARVLAAAAEGDPAALERAGPLLRDRVKLRAGNAPCAPGRLTLQGSRLGDSRLIVDLWFRCPTEPRQLTVRDDWADLLGSHYRTIARVEGRAGGREVVFLPDAREAVVDVAGGGASGGGFFRLGVEHILTGWDHLLFLLALLLRGGGLGALIRIVTAFTVAHSLTLALAVLRVVTLPDRFVEAAIAGSIAWVAVENVIRRDPPARRWLVSGAFGLVHGLGFASALTPLALPGWRLAGALFGFNLGVEAGQAAVVLAALPPLRWAARQPWEPRAVRGASALLALTGGAWLVGRLFFA